MEDYSNCLLSLSYWGPIQYFSKFLIYDNISIELHENYQRKSFRNRCELYGANGKQSIQVPVARGSFHKTNMKDLEIAYDTNWQKNHFKTIESAYKSSPFYEYYEDDIIPLYEKKTKYLVDFNTQLLQLCLDWLTIDKQPSFTETYQENCEGRDYRSAIHPKQQAFLNDHLFSAKDYIQGFEQRNGFIPNLSILDLVFNLGPESYSLLKQSCKG